MIKVCAFDCFGTVFDAGGLNRSLVADYVAHVNRADFSPYLFPQAWYELPAHPDSAEGVRRLRAAGIRCVTLSNGSRELITALSNRAGIEWDAVIDLTAHKVYKPHAAAYQTVEKETGVKPAECLMVTANPKFGDVQGAWRVGMQAIVIRNGVIDTIVELAELLEEQSKS